jgi:peptidoglycan/LPS O-acetylase OafA/YrhL
MIHEPMRALRDILLSDRGPGNAKFFYSFCWIFVVFFAAWLFYRLFERPAMAYRKTGSQRSLVR